MPSPFTCPHCGAEPFLAGDLPPDELRCRRCGTVYPFGDRDRRLRPAALLRNGVRPRDDDEDDDDDRPRRKKKAASSNTMVLVLAGVSAFVMLLICAGTVGVVWWVVTKEPTQQPQGPLVQGPKAPGQMPMPKGPPGIPPGLPPGALPPGPGAPPPGAPPIGPGPQAPKGAIVVGQPAPEIEAEDLDGKRFKLSDYRGKVVLLDFWGNW
jgi:hypothetical protein